MVMGASNSTTITMVEFFNGYLPEMADGISDQ
jgi:hypothetical protein